MSISLLMNTTCDVMQEVVSKSSTGFNNVTSFSTVTAGLSCRVHDLKPDQAMVIFGKFDAVHQKTFYFATSPGALTTKHWLNWNGTKYQVHSVQNMGGNLNRLWRVDAEAKPSA